MNHTNSFQKFDKSTIIVGPCSVESENQMRLLVESFKELSTPLHFLRGGIWKPRTRPDTFEGVGAIGLKWLKNAADELNIPALTEVAKPSHVEDCLKAGINSFWIGARTCSNPFSVQDLADSVKGEKVRLFIKNPVVPDVQMWIGAYERFNKAGIDSISVIHRGFSMINNSKYRNPPLWEIPIEFKRLLPEVPILCDPSHIGGNRTSLKKIAQKALDLGMNGFMIETHPKPDEALSDASQQITPQKLMELLLGLEIRKQQFDDHQIIDKLQILRESIDRTDKELLELFTKRLELVKEIGQYKRDNNVMIFQMNRWEEILRTRKLLGKEYFLSEDFIQGLFEIIHKESIRFQTKIVGQKPQPKSNL